MDPWLPPSPSPRTAPLVPRFPLFTMVRRALLARLVLLVLLALRLCMARMARMARMACVSPISYRTPRLPPPISLSTCVPLHPQGVWAVCSAGSPASRSDRGASIPPTATPPSSRRLGSLPKRLLRVPLLKSWTRGTRGTWRPRPASVLITRAYRAFKNRSETRCLICRA